jgi:hypothetical protein
MDFDLQSILVTTLFSNFQFNEERIFCNLFGYELALIGNKQIFFSEAAEFLLFSLAQCLEQIFPTFWL